MTSRVENNHWSNSCPKIGKCNVNNCLCYRDYLQWTKDNKPLSFKHWKDIILIERPGLDEQYN